MKIKNYLSEPHGYHRASSSISEIPRCNFGDTVDLTGAAGRWRLGDVQRAAN